MKSICDGEEDKEAVMYQTEEAWAANLLLVEDWGVSLS